MSMSVGASGALYGLLGAYAARRYVLYRMPLDSQELAWLAQVIGINFVLSLLANVDIYGHLGGLAGGAALTLLWANSQRRRW